MAASYTRDDLRAAAGWKSFQRGEDYVDAVANLRLLNGVLHATVYGTEPYRVQLGIADGGLGGDCTCPHAADGYFCKHLVAVGLAKLDGVGTGEGPENDEQGDDGTEHRRKRNLMAELDAHGL